MNTPPTNSHRTTGRKKHSDRPTRFEISLPQSLADKLHLHLLDPITNTPAYGARSKLIQVLLREYFTSMASSGSGTLDTKLFERLTSLSRNMTKVEMLATLEDILTKSGFTQSAALLLTHLNNLLEDTPNDL